MFEKLQILTDEQREEGEKFGYNKFSIVLQGFYGWGKGYYSEDARDDFDALTRGCVRQFGDTYTDGVRFKYVFHKDSCDEIKPRDNSSNPTYAYLHPMDFSGYGGKDFIDGLVSAMRKGLKELGLEDKYKITGVKYIPVPLISDSDYEKIIISHAKEIIAEAKDYKEQSGIEMKYLADCVAQEFMEHGNIIRAGDSTGFSSSDPIYRAVRNLVLTAQELGAFDKPRQKKKTAEQEK